MIVYKINKSIMIAIMLLLNLEKIIYQIKIK